MRKFLSFFCFLACLFVVNKVQSTEFVVSGEYLYWTAVQRDMEFMRTGSPSGLSFPGVKLGDDHIHEAEYDWSSGYRIAAGFNISECCFFSPKVTYTQFHTKGKKSAFATLNDSNVFQGVPSFPPAIPTSSQKFYILGIATVAEGHSRTKLDVDYIDLAIVRSHCCSGLLNFFGEFGLRGAFLKSHWTTDYLVQLAASEDVVAIAPETVKINWKYEAGGMFLSGGGALELGCGLRGYQTFTGSLLLGQLRRKSIGFIIPEFIGVPVGICDIRHSRTKIVPFFGSETGVDYVYNDCRNFNIRLKVAFEYMKWFGVGENFFYTIPLGSPFKDNCWVDIDLWGLTTGIAVEF